MLGVIEKLRNGDRAFMGCLALVIVLLAVVLRSSLGVGEAVAVTAPGDMKIARVEARVPAPVAPAETAPPGSLAEAFGTIVKPVPLPEGVKRFGIVGGKTASLKDYPGRVKIEITTWSVARQRLEVEHCAADIIEPDRVDSAGHCFKAGWSEVRIFFGDESRREARVVKPADVIIHSGYNGAGDPRDLAVLMLQEPLPDSVETRNYAKSIEVMRLIGQPVPIASWGLTGPPQDMDSVVPDMLLETKVRIVAADDVTVEAEAINGSGDCQGGSGTGLGSAVTLGRFSGVYPSPSGKTCDGKAYRMIFIAPGYANEWGTGVAAAWRAENR